MLTRARWLLLVAISGAALFALSFVNAWIVHDRELTGEGFRHVTHMLSAWRGVGMPVLTIGAVMALVVAVIAIVGVRARPALPTWLLVAGAVVVLGTVASAAWPASQHGHASRVGLSVGPLVIVGAVLGAVMLAGALAVARPSGRLVVAALGGVLVVFAAGAAARSAGLQLAEGQGRHWSEGSYTRSATGDQPTETLTIRDGTYAISERWSGTWEWSGWTVVVTDDPACPDARGTYHAHDAENEALRFVMVVDTCREGERAADLQTGIWQRD